MLKYEIRYQNPNRKYEKFLKNWKSNIINYKIGLSVDLFQIHVVRAAHPVF